VAPKSGEIRCYVKKMKLIFEGTKKFEKDRKKFCIKDQDEIIKKINIYCQSFKNNQTDFFSHAFQPYILKLKNNFASSLYVLRINLNIRVILTIDEDPIFNQMIVTLHRVLRRAELGNAYKDIAKSIYQKELKEIRGKRNSDGQN
jgi:hypothetical protein